MMQDLCQLSLRRGIPEGVGGALRPRLEVGSRSHDGPHRQALTAAVTSETNPDTVWRALDMYSEPSRAP